MPRQLIYKALQEEIKNYIIKNRLKPGDPLPPETELAQQLGVSRNSLREAVKSLETLGILEAKPGAGLFVRSFTFDPLLNHLAYGLMFDLKSLSDLLEVRVHLECGMAERAVRASTPEQLRDLFAILQEMRAEAEQGRYAVEADRQFHQKLWQNVDNRVLAQVLDVFWVAFHEAKQRLNIPEPADPMETYRRHLAIATALAAGDVEELRAAIARSHTGIAERIRQAEQLAANRQEPQVKT